MAERRLARVGMSWLLIGFASLAYVPVPCEQRSPPRILRSTPYSTPALTFDFVVLRDRALIFETLE